MLTSVLYKFKTTTFIINWYDIMQSTTQTQSSPYSPIRYIVSILALATAVTAILTPAVSGYLLQPFINNLYLQPLSYQLERASQQHSHSLYSKLGQDSALQAKYQQITKILTALAREQDIKLSANPVVNVQVTPGWLYTTAYREQQWQLNLPLKQLRKNHRLAAALHAAGLDLNLTDTGYVLSLGEYGVFHHAQLLPFFSPPQAQQQISITLSPISQHQHSHQPGTKSPLNDTVQTHSPTVSKQSSYTAYVTSPDCQTIAQQAHQAGLNLPGWHSISSSKDTLLTLTAESIFSSKITTTFRVSQLPPSPQMLAKLLLPIADKHSPQVDSQQVFDFFLRGYEHYANTLQQARYTVVHDYSNKVISTQISSQTPEWNNRPLSFDKNPPKILKLIRQNTQPKHTHSAFQYNGRGYEAKSDSTSRVDFELPELYGDSKLSLDITRTTKKSLRNEEAKRKIHIKGVFSSNCPSDNHFTTVEPQTKPQAKQNNPLLTAPDLKNIKTYLDLLHQLLPVIVEHDIDVTTYQTKNNDLLFTVLELFADEFIYHYNAKVKQPQGKDDDLRARSDAALQQLLKTTHVMMKKLTELPIRLKWNMRQSIPHGTIIIHLDAQQHQGQLSKAQGVTTSSAESQSDPSTAVRSLQLDMSISQDLIAFLDRFAQEISANYSPADACQKLFEILLKHKMLTKQGNAYKLNLTLNPDYFVLTDESYNYPTTLQPHNSKLYVKMKQIFQEIETKIEKVSTKSAQPNPILMPEKTTPKTPPQPLTKP